MVLFDIKLSSDFYIILKFSVTAMNKYWNTHSSVMVDNEEYADTDF